MAEKKFFDYAPTTITPPINATWFLDSQVYRIATGTLATQRVGNKIFIHSIEYSFTCTCNVANIPATGGFIKFILWHDKETNGTNISATTLFNVDNILSVRNTSSQPKCSILKEMNCHMVNTTATTAGPQHQWKWKIYPKKRVDYTNSTASISDILKDNWGFGICQSVSQATAFATIAYSLKIIYSDS